MTSPYLNIRPRSLGEVEAARVDTVAAMCDELRRRYIKKTGSPHSTVSLWISPFGPSVNFYGLVDYSAKGTTLSEAFAAANAWLDRDQNAENNATLGLAPDGRFVSEVV